LSRDPFVSAAWVVAAFESAPLSESTPSPVDDFSALVQRDATAAHLAASTAPSVVASAAFPAVATLHGFDLQDQPLISNVALCPGQVLTARSTVALQQALIGRSVVVVFEGGNPQAPIIMGVMEPHPLAAKLPSPGVTVQADDERHVITAEREMVLRCGNASITLTRAGKVIIKGDYILSRSTGINKIKGAAIDIN
jgi:Domain of unknown function (DUF6484)